MEIATTVATSCVMVVFHVLRIVSLILAAVIAVSVLSVVFWLICAVVLVLAIGAWVLERICRT